MDTAVALVQAYLQVNGYFTVCEYPILKVDHGEVRVATDIDMLAFRFPGAGREMQTRGGTVSGVVAHEPDSALGCTPGQADMIVGEVKEGRARFNEPIRDPKVLGAALARFGCCSPDHAGDMVDRLLKHGRVHTPHGHDVRMIAFGGRGAPSGEGWLRIPLEHIIRFLRAYLDENWAQLHKAQIKAPALDLLALLRKCGG